MSTRRVTALGASFVCNVLKTKWPVNANEWRSLPFQVSNLSDHDHIGILADNMAQTGAKRQANLWINLNLVNAIHLILNGILDGDDFRSGMLIRSRAL